jgi:hypothetical protein
MTLFTQMGNVLTALLPLLSQQQDKTKRKSSKQASFVFFQFYPGTYEARSVNIQEISEKADD